MYLSFVLSGRYNLHVPVLTCKHCNKQWAPEVGDFVRSGYWPATMHSQTLFHQDLFRSFEAMKTASPGMSMKGFTAMLDQRTEQFGRVSKFEADRQIHLVLLEVLLDAVLDFSSRGAQMRILSKDVYNTSGQLITS